MERQDFINTINELKAMVSSLKLTIDTLRQTISSQNATIASLQESMDRLQSAYAKAVKERDEWSSKDDNNNGTSSAASIDCGVDQTKVKSENLNRSGRNGMKYDRMNTARTVTLETSLEGAPEDMRLIDYKEVEVVDHFMLMTPIYRRSVRNVIDKLQISRNTSRNWLAHGAEMLTPILHFLRKRLLEAKSIRYTPEQIKNRRHRRDVDKILSLIYKRSNKMLRNPNRYHYSEMMRKALVYVSSMSYAH